MKFDDLIDETGFSQSSLKIDQGERTTFGRISAVFCSFNRAGTAAGIVVVVAVDVVVVVVVITVLVVVILVLVFVVILVLLCGCYHCSFSA